MSGPLDRVHRKALPRKWGNGFSGLFFPVHQVLTDVAPEIFAGIIDVSNGFQRGSDGLGDAVTQGGDGQYPSSGGNTLR